MFHAVQFWHANLIEKHYLSNTCHCCQPCKWLKMLLQENHPAGPTGSSACGSVLPRRDLRTSQHLTSTNEHRHSSAPSTSVVQTSDQSVEMGTNATHSRALAAPPPVSNCRACFLLSQSLGSCVSGRQLTGKEYDFPAKIPPAVQEAICHSLEINREHKEKFGTRRRVV